MLKSIVFDLDDTICWPNHGEKDTYKKYGLAQPNQKVIDYMHRLKQLQFQITISSARRMLTHNGNVEKVIEDVGDITIAWLEKHNVPYDHIHFGKPYASSYYVDDKAMTIDNFYKWMEEEWT